MKRVLEVLAPLMILGAMLAGLSGCDVIKADLELKAAQANNGTANAQAMMAQANADAVRANAGATIEGDKERSQRLAYLLAYFASPAARESQNATCYWAVVAMLCGGMLFVIGLQAWARGR
jgi:hypothetical protein